MNDRLMNLVVVAVGTAIFLIYIAFITNYIAGGTPRIAVTVGLLITLGLLSAILMRGHLLTKLGFLAVVPVLHIVYEGMDPAKPTLNLLVGAIELGCIWLGAAVGHLVRRKQPTPAA